MSAGGGLTGPDLGAGVPLSEIPDGGMLLGHARGKAVLLARRGDAIHALDAVCTHYGAPLSDGVLAGDTVRCPWHHACFDLRSGAALKAPALRPLGTWAVEWRGALVVVTGERGATPMAAHPGVDPGTLGITVVIVGAGAAGDAAADVLRREGHAGPVTLIGADEALPSDRPNLSKDYLAGNAPEEWIPLRAPGFYEERNITVLPGRVATRIDCASRRVLLDDGRALPYDRLLLATGAAPIQLPDAVSGGRVRYLRTLADSRAIVRAAVGARRAVVIGASFIGLEVAASLRARGLEVHVVAPEDRPLERVLGRAIGDFVRSVHEAHGVILHLGRTAAACDAAGVTLDDGTRLAADLIVAGIGVRPNEQLAMDAGLPANRGIVVDRFLTTLDPAIHAAGDVARYPDPRSGTHIRVEHWVVAQRQGHIAALNMLGARKPFDDVPFFWSQHYDVTINYVGHAERWDALRIEGSIADRDCAVHFISEGRTLAVATIGRDRASLAAELLMESESGAQRS